MTFLAIIIALVLMQVWGSGSRVHRDDWFLDWQSRAANWSAGPQVKLALVVLLPVVLAQVILGVLVPFLFGLLWIAMAVVLLLYSFGRRDFHDLMRHYREQCRSADFEGAYLSTLPELGWATSQDDPVSPREVHALVQRGFIYEGYQRWFAVLFYFVLLGPAGALAYRLLQLCRHDFEAEHTERWIFLTDWIPARLLAAAFTLTGDFVGSRDKLLDGLADTSVQSSQLLYTVGTAALGNVRVESPDDLPDDLAFGQAAAVQNKETDSLLLRSAAAWVAVLSVAVLLL
jgi:AmpE protein